MAYSKNIKKLKKLSKNNGKQGEEIPKDKVINKPS